MTIRPITTQRLLQWFWPVQLLAGGIRKPDEPSDERESRALLFPEFTMFGHDPVITNVPRLTTERELALNPYDPNESPTLAVTPNESQYGVSRIVRPAVYLHLVVVALTGLGMTHDIRSIIWPEQWIPLIQLGLLFGTVGFFACPIAFLIGLARSTTSVSRRMTLFGVEAMIVIVHLIALIPSVQ